MPKTRPTRSSVTSTATLRIRRSAATTFVRESRNGRADRMSSTGAAGASSTRTAGFVLTGTSLLLRASALVADDHGVRLRDERGEAGQEHRRDERARRKAAGDKPRQQGQQQPVAQTRSDPDRD